jgi:hypothetical protein
MKTYVTILFNSEGTAPSEVKDSLLNMGFKAAKGNYDFVYEWPTGVHDINELVFFADKVYTALKGSKVLFSIETT